MSLVTKVIFPIPPPTTNDLSSHHRNLLLRKAKKLEQIFGATPCLLDNTLETSEPIHIAFPRRPSQHRQTKTSLESISTFSSETPSPRKRSRAGSESCLSPFICNDNSLASPMSPVVDITNSCEGWPRRLKGPVMRLFMKAPTLEVIPGPSSPDKTSSPHSPRQSPNSDVLFTQCSVIPDEDPSLRNSTIPDSYNITSLSSLRKQKMDRLRKKLGQDVPFNLVFPSSESESEQRISPIKECSVLLPPPTPRRTNSGRLSNVRDSIVGCDSVHRAKRHTLAVTKPSLTRVPAKSESSEPKRLSFIIESPNEHGVGCAQDFGLPHELEQGAEFASDWGVSASTEVKLWSTRRGYEGWRFDPPSKALQSPTTRSYSLPPSAPKSVTSNTEFKKKPSSYRKPVPHLFD